MSKIAKFDLNLRPQTPFSRHCFETQQHIWNIKELAKRRWSLCMCPGKISCSSAHSPVWNGLYGLFGLQCTKTAKIDSFLASKYIENAFAGLRPEIRPDPAGDLNPLAGFKWATSRQEREGKEGCKDAKKRWWNKGEKEKGKGKKRKERKGRMVPNF